MPMQYQPKTILLSLVLLSVGLPGYCQKFAAARELGELQPAWYNLVLPPALTATLRADMGDLRVYGITSSDTVEAPYVLVGQEPKISTARQAFTLLNASQRNGLFYYTYQLPAGKQINMVELETTQQNFTWQVTVEGSHNQHEWFVLAEKQHLVGIENKLTHYKFTRIALPLANYRYFRLTVKSPRSPNITQAYLTHNDTVTGPKLVSPLTISESVHSKKRGQSAWLLALPDALTVQGLELNFSNTYEYYRLVHVQVLADSIETGRGTVANWRNVYNGYVSSLEKNRLSFSATAAKYIKVEVNNLDSPPLALSGAKAYSYPYNLMLRVDTPGRYALHYGNNQTRAPQYDIAQFASRLMPADMPRLTLGPETKVGPEVKAVGLLESKLWLYGILTLVGGLLGYFAYSMLKE